jgi:hypothetical protein
MANNLTSDDILQQINQVTSNLEESSGEPEDDDVVSFRSPEPAPSQGYNAPDDYDDPQRELADYLERDNSEREQWRAEETARIKAEYARTGNVPQYRNYEEWKEHKEYFAPEINPERMAQALQEDVQDLIERYPRSSASFLRKVQLGQIAFPDGYETIPNALEVLFLDSITPAESRAMDTDTLAELIGHAEFEDERRQPLRTRSLDVAVPQRVKPPKPKVKKAPTYTLPDLTQEEMREALSWAIEKKMRGGR